MSDKIQREYFDKSRGAMVTQTGGRADCAHVRTRDDGHGTVTIFQVCLDCEARLCVATGHDPFLSAQESAGEP